MSETKVTYNFFKAKEKELLISLGKEQFLDALSHMLLIRNFELRAEAAYQQGKVGGFFHAYIGQEAIQTAAVQVFGVDHNWWITTYRCHALALLLGVDPNEIMAELYGKVTGNALGRGGSMHLYSDRMLGGFGIVGGHIPIAAGAAFSVKYKKEKGVAVCFLGEGAVVQGAFHESMNLAALWDLPLIIVIENNQWGMGTAVKRAVCVQPIAEHFAKGYGVASITFDGMNYLDCYAAFQHAQEYVQKNKRPILMEAVTQRFKGHSVSDPGLYRSKEELAKAMKHDPIIFMKKWASEQGYIDEEGFKALDKKQKDRVLAAMKFADESPEPDPKELEDDVFAPEGE